MKCLFLGLRGRATATLQSVWGSMWSTATPPPLLCSLQRGCETCQPTATFPLGVQVTVHVYPFNFKYTAHSTLYIACRRITHNTLYCALHEVVENVTTTSARLAHWENVDLLKETYFQEEAEKKRKKKHTVTTWCHGNHQENILSTAIS